MLQDAVNNSFQDMISTQDKVWYYLNKNKPYSSTYTVTFKFLYYTTSQSSNQDPAEFLNYRIQFKSEKNLKVHDLSQFLSITYTSSLGSSPILCLIKSLQFIILQDF